MDFQYQPRSQKEHSENNDNFSYQLQTKIENKNPCSNSFRNDKKYLNNKDKVEDRECSPSESLHLDLKSRKEQSKSILMDFKEIKKEVANTKDPKLNSSFHYDKNLKNINKQVNSHYDDDSY